MQAEEGKACLGYCSTTERDHKVLGGIIMQSWVDAIFDSSCSESLTDDGGLATALVDSRYQDQWQLKFKYLQTERVIPKLMHGWP